MVSDLTSIQQLKKSGKKIVFTNGCFDVLHVAHIRLLEQAKKLGDCLIIGINTDASVQRLKGSNRPYYPLSERIEILAALKVVDGVIPFDEDIPLNLIQKIKPDVLVKGGDYKKDQIVGSKEVESWGGRIVIFPYIEGYSTTNTLKQVKS